MLTGYTPFSIMCNGRQFLGKKNKAMPDGLLGILQWSTLHNFIGITNGTAIHPHKQRQKVTQQRGPNFQCLGISLLRIKSARTAWLELETQILKLEEMKSLKYFLALTRCWVILECGCSHLLRLNFLMDT